MRINFSPVKAINNIKLTNFSTNPIKFKGLEADTFTKKEENLEEKLQEIFDCEKEIEQAQEELSAAKNSLDKLSRKIKQDCEYKGPFMYHPLYPEEKELFDIVDSIQLKIRNLKAKREKIAAKANPNTAFLADENIRPFQKRNILREHPEIIRLFDVRRAEIDSYHKRLVYGKTPYFITNKAVSNSYLDTSFEPNRENYAIFSNPDILSHLEFLDKFDFSANELNRYIREELIIEEKMLNLHTKEKEPVHLININSPEVQEGLKRHEKIKSFYPKRSRFITKKFVPVAYLAQLGYGNLKDIENAIRCKQIPGKFQVVETEDGPKTAAYVNIQNPNILGGLEFLRNENKYNVSLEGFAKLAKSSISDIEDAILSGEIVPIPECIFAREEKEIRFNLRNKKNKEFIEKRQFEAQLSRMNSIKRNNERTSLRNVIAWALCPNTKQIAKSTVAMYPEIKAIFEKEEEIKDYLERKEKDLLEENETAPYLTKQERKSLRRFYKEVWNQAGTEEYKLANQKAKIAINEYKEGGLENVSDEKIRAIIEAFYLKLQENNEQII